MKTRKIIIAVLLVILAGSVCYGIWGIKEPEVQQVMPQENLTVVEAPEQTEAMEHPDFVKEEYVPVIPEGTNIAPDAKIEADSFAPGYTARKAIDGKTDGASYWEGAADSYPNQLSLDFGEEKAIHAVRLCLCPDDIWAKRTQNIQVFVSADGENYDELVAAADYEFDPAKGNEAVIAFDEVSTQFVRIVFNSNTGAGAGQAAEVEVYAQ